VCLAYVSILGIKYIIEQGDAFLTDQENFSLFSRSNIKKVKYFLFASLKTHFLFSLEILKQIIHAKYDGLNY
jgi:hypothetical protein